MSSRCRKCGRRLTDPDSQARGFGPECWQSIGGESAGSGADPDEHEPIAGQISIYDYLEGINDEGEESDLPEMWKGVQ